MQLPLFQTRQLSLEKYRSRIKKNPNPVFLLKIYNEVTSEGLNPSVVIMFLVDCMFETDWQKLFNEYSKRGYMTFFEFRIGATEFDCYDTNGGVWINNNQISSWNESQTYNDKTMTKIKEKVKTHISANSQQYHYLILKEND